MKSIEMLVKGGSSAARYFMNISQIFHSEFRASGRFNYTPLFALYSIDRTMEMVEKYSHYVGCVRYECFSKDVLSHRSIDQCLNADEENVGIGRQAFPRTFESSFMRMTRNERALDIDRPYGGATRFLCNQVRSINGRVPSCSTV